MKSLFDRLLRYRRRKTRAVALVHRQSSSSARGGRHRRITLERLEERLTPSGETVTASFSAIPVQKTVTVSFDATVDTPLPKGIDRVFNQGSVSGSGFATIKTDGSLPPGSAGPLVTSVERGPMVSGVFFRSSSWSQAFLNNLQAQGLGDSTLGYSVPGAGGQQTSIPWPNLDRVSIRFTSNVNIAAGSLSILGTYNASYPVGTTVLSYDPTTFTATWAITSPLVADGLRLILASAGVSNVGGNARLDGDWIDGTAVYPSGDGAAGSDFSFRFNVVPGDVNRDRISNSADLGLIRQNIGSNLVTADLNGSGTVTEPDFDLARALIGKGLLIIPPAGRPGSGWVAVAATPTPPNPPGVAGTNVTASVESFLINDVDRDGRIDPGDRIRYVVSIRNFGSTITSATLTDTLDPFVTFVAGSVKLSPVPFDDAYSTPSNTPLTVNAAQGVLANDVDGNTPPGPLTVVGAITTSPFDTIAINPDGSFTFTPGGGFQGTTSFLYTVQNSTGLQAVGKAILTITNSAPILAAIESSSLVYTLSDTPAAITSALTVTDPDNTNLAGATVAITGGFQSGQDLLNFTDQNGITGSYNPVGGVLTLTGSSSVANYQTALRSVTFSNANNNSSTATRTIIYRANDGGSSNNLSNVVSRTVSVVPVHFELTVPPTATAGAAFSFTVTAKNPANNTVQGYLGTVHFTSTDGQAILPADYTFTVGDHGVHTFADAATLKTAGGQTITATDTATPASNGTSGTITVSPAAAHHLAFLQQPTTATAGVAISPAVTVQIVDQFNNLTTSAASVTVAIGTNPGGGTLSGTTTVPASGGVATFNTLSINKSGTGYTLTAASAGLTGATSASFSITPAAADHLAFAQQPTSAVAGVAISPAVTVQLLDQFNNLTASTANVTVAIGTNPGGGTLSGTATVAASGGVATFSTLSINKTGTGYALTAASAGLTGATSGTFNITPAAADHLAFLQQPTSAVAGVAISPAVTVQLLDQFNNLTTSTANVTVAIGTNPGGGTLSGTATVAASGGVATFSDLSINKTGTGYTLAASSGSLTGATSAAFSITPAAADHLLFAQQPTTATAGVAIAPAVTVQIVDQFNNLTASTASVTVAIGTNPGGGTLSGTATVAATGGVATFGDLSINKTGTGYTLTAASAALTGAISAAFSITPAAADHLAFLQQPTSAVAGVAISPAVTVQLLDQFNNLTTSTASVTVAIGANPGPGTLSGTTTVPASGGVATFSNLSINKTGDGYTLTAASAGLTGATSAAFNIIAAAADHLVFQQQPTTAVAGVAISPAVTVRILDAFDNLTPSTASVTVAIGTNPGGGTLSGTTTVSAVGGTATFNTLSINKTGTGYTLTAASMGLTGATSSTFDITPAAADHLAFLQQPTTTTAGVAISPAVTVQILDQFNNLTPSTASVTVAATGPGSFTGASTTTVAAAGGVASFSNLVLNTAGSYTIGATSAGLTGATSNSFTVNPAAADHLLVVAPATALVGFPFNFTVTAQDQFNNTATGYTGALNFTSTDGSATLPPPGSTLTSGTGTFSATLNATGMWTITATDTVTPSLTDTSDPINAVTNAAPVVTAGGTLSYNENQAATAIDPTVTVMDTDSPTLASATVQLTTNYANGQDILNFTAIGGNPVTNGGFNASNGTLTLIGNGANPAQMTAALQAVTYFNNSEAPSNSPRTVVWQVNDGAAGNNLSAPVTSTINVTAVNDAPTATAPASYSATEQVSLNLKNTGLSVADVDGGVGSETLTITVGSGVLNAATGTSGATVGGSGTTTLTISGTIAQINAFLNTDGASTISYINNLNTPPASVTLNLSINDNGNTGTGGPLTGTATSTINITAVNDAPTATAPASYTATEQVSLNLKNTGLSVADVDAGAGSVTLTISVPAGGSGVLSATAGASGAGVSGSGTNSLTITGTLAQINALLNTDGTSTISYINTSNTPPASQVLTLSINDNGNTGSGGPMTGTATSTINITAVNDAPVAIDVSYSTVGNTQLHVAGATITGVAAVTDSQSILTKGPPTDVDGPGPLDIVAVSGSSANGGSFTVNADGSFTYVPPAGFTGTDNFSYTVQDHGSPNGTDTGTVNITVSQLVWYVDNTAAAGGTGRSNAPFNSLTPLTTGGTADALDGAGDIIFVFQGSGNTTGGIVLETNQKLWGQPFGLTVNTIPLVAAGGSNPTVTNSAGAGIVLANGVDVQRVNVSGTSGDGIVGTGVTNATIGGNTSITSAGGAGFKLTGAASGAVSVGASISGSTGRAVDIQNRSGGTVTLSGSVTASGGQGVFLDSNTGATINLSGGLSLTTGANTAFTATNGGTLNITGTNTINAATGTAIIMTGVTIGASNATFASVTSGGGTNNVSLTNLAGSLTMSAGALTGSTGGAFLVSGGSATVLYSGTITNTANRMISVSNTTGGSVTFNTATANGLVDSGTGILVDGAVGGVTVNNADLNGSRGIEILGDTANNATGTFTFNNVTIDTTAGATNHAVNIDGDQGTATNDDVNATIDFNNVDITNPGGNVLRILGMNGGSVDFDSASAFSRTNGGLGILIDSNAGGTISIGGSTKTLNTATNAAVTISNNAATVNFPNGGLDIDTTTGAGFIATGGGTISVTGTGNSITTTTGTALDLNGVTLGANGVTFATVTTNGAATGISVLAVAQAAGSTGLDVLGGTIAGATTTGVRIDATSADVAIAATVADTAAGRTVHVTNSGRNVAGGSQIVFSAAIDENGLGILLDNNDQNTQGAVLTFSGGLDIDTTTGIGFSATNGGTVNVTGSNNSINSVSATALNVANTTIGGSGLTFHDISSGNNTAAGDPASGIVLNSTGSSGVLTVTGNGTTTVGGDNSGGTIQNTTSHGVLLTNALSPSFTNLRIQNTVGSGIEGTGVVNFTLNNSTVDNSGTGGGPDDSNVAFNNQAAGTENNLSGTVTITNNSLTNARWHGIMIQNFNGTLANAIVTGNTITSGTTLASSLGYGINFQILGSATTVSNLTKATITGNTVTNFPSAGGIQIQGGNSNAAGTAGVLGMAGSATDIISITGNFVRGASATNRMATSAILFTVSGKGQGNVAIDNNGSALNPIAHTTGTTIGVGANGNTTLTATTNNNFVTSSHTGTGASGASGISGGAGITFGVSDTTNMTWIISGNTINDVDGNGILAVARATQGVLKVKISNNIVEAPMGGVRPGIRADSGNGAAGEDNGVFLNIFGNTSAGSGGSEGIGVRKQGTVSTTNDFGIFDAAGGPTLNSPPTNAQVETFIEALNPAGGGAFVINGDNFQRDTTQAPPQLALGGERYARTAVVPVTSEQLPAILAEAVRRWEAMGLSATDSARLRETTALVSDLPDGYLGTAPLFGHTISVDINAAGYGWFVDPTPADDSEFGLGMADSPAAERMDLLTVVMHELGHVIGLDSRYDGDTSDLMYVYLGAGSRRLPGAAEVPGVAIPVASSVAGVIDPGPRVPKGLADPASLRPATEERKEERTFVESRIRVGSVPRDSVNWWEVSTELRRARRRATFTVNPEFGVTDE